MGPGTERPQAAMNCVPLPLLSLNMLSSHGNDLPVSPWGLLTSLKRIMGSAAAQTEWGRCSDHHCKEATPPPHLVCWPPGDGQWAILVPGPEASPVGPAGRWWGKGGELILALHSLPFLRPHSAIRPEKQSLSLGDASLLGWM